MIFHFLPPLSLGPSVLFSTLRLESYIQQCKVKSSPSRDVWKKFTSSPGDDPSNTMLLHCLHAFKMIFIHYCAYQVTHNPPGDPHPPPSPHHQEGEGGASSSFQASFSLPFENAPPPPANHGFKQSAHTAPKSGSSPPPQSFSKGGQSGISPRIRPGPRP